MEQKDFWRVGRGETQATRKQNERDLYIMSALEQEKSVVTNLIDVCKDGRDFYRNASENIEGKELETIFVDSANTREAIIVGLEEYMKDQGESVEADGTVKGKAASIYGQLAAKITPDTEKTLVTQLEEAEDRSLETFKEATTRNITPELKAKIENYANDMQQTHDRMKAIKDTLKAA